MRQDLTVKVVIFCGVIALGFIAFSYKEYTIYHPIVPERNIMINSGDTCHKWTDVADLFVWQGKKYNENDGIIYQCLTGDVYASDSRIGNTRIFTNDFKDVGNYSAEDAKRQDTFQNKFHPAHKDRMSSEHKVSGVGSTLQAGQAPITLLNAIIERLKIYLNKPVISIVDIPCGDFYWIRELVSRRQDVRYTGVDIVPTLIERHRKNYRHLKNAQFKHMDIVQYKLDESYDIILSRDMLQHLRTADAMKALEHLSSSGSRLLVTTNHNHNSSRNADINNAGFRSMNLMLPPVNLTPPVCQIPDRVATKLPKDLAVWKLPLKQFV